jgi:hypothetical protein
VQSETEHTLALSCIKFTADEVLGIGTTPIEALKSNMAYDN